MNIKASLTSVWWDFKDIWFLLPQEKQHEKAVWLKGFLNIELNYSS